MAAEEQIQAPGVEPLHVRHWSHHLRVHHVHVIPHFLLQEPAPEGRVITSAHLDLSLNEILKSYFFCFFFRFAYDRYCFFSEDIKAYQLAAT